MLVLRCVSLGFCCEIDESCAAAKPYITVENCLAFGHEYLAQQHTNYWEEGSLARKKFFLEHRTNKEFYKWQDEQESKSRDEQEKSELSSEDKSIETTTI